jgi:hypothetical protein
VPHINFAHLFSIDCRNPTSRPFRSILRGSRGRHGSVSIGENISSEIGVVKYVLLLFLMRSLMSQVPAGEKDCARVWGEFADCLARWRFGSLLGYIDKTGKTVIEPRFQRLLTDSESVLDGQRHRAAAIHKRTAPFPRRSVLQIVIIAVAKTLIASSCRFTGYPEPWYQHDPSDDEPRQLYEMPNNQPCASAPVIVERT